MNIIGHISTDFPTKFGIPRQSGLIDELKVVITFEPECIPQTVKSELPVNATSIRCDVRLKEV